MTTRLTQGRGPHATELALILSLALAMRLPMLAADFWFDEIFWLERFVRPATSAFEILFGPSFRHDNNHHLQTLTAYLIGGAPWFVYRLPPLLFGLGALAAAMRIGHRHGSASRRITALLVAVSLMMVVSSAEARGYAAAICASAVGFLAADRFLADRRLSAGLWFSAAIVVGLAAHPAILHFYLGALLWSGYRLRGNLRAFARLHAFPAIWIAGWFALVVRGSIVGGGPPWTWRQIGDESLAWTFGYPLQTIAPALAAGVLLIVVLWDARQLWAEGSDEGLFSIGAIVAPVVLMASLSPPFLFPRYFLVPIFFLLIVAGRSLGRLFTRGRIARASAVLVVCAIAAGNIAALASFARQRYRNHDRAVSLMLAVAHSPVRVTSQSLDQWTELPLQFHARRQHAADRLEYVPRAKQTSLSSDDPPIDWLVEPDQPCGRPPRRTRTLANGIVFWLRQSFEVCGPSGMSWHLYSPASAPVAAP